MKRLIYILAALPFLFTSCFPTRIVTVSPSYESTYRPQYSYTTTTVTVPKTNTVTTNSYTVSAIDDISMHLDLQAVAAAFAQSSNVRDFEILLNNSSYMISNLDLNNDGYVDYLRVLETVNGYAHVFVIQAVLSPNVYQDVATIVAEANSYSNYRVQVIGAPFIYGPNYIVEPVFYARPVIITHLCSYSYRPWRSPYCWGYYPSHYTRHCPVLLSHYHAYVDTYMVHHHYCHKVSYPTYVHYTNYITVSASSSRNDYATAHPEKTFITRTANIPAVSAAGSRANASTVRESRDAQATSTTTSGNRTSSNRTATTTAGTTRPASSTSGSRTTSSSTTTTRPAATSGTTTATRPASTTTTTRPASSTSGSRTTSSSTTTTRPAATSGTTTATKPASTTTTTRPASSTSGSRTTSTTSTTSTRVNSNGSASTRSTTSSSARSASSSVSRSTGSSSSRSTSSSSTRSASSASSTRSTSSSSRSPRR